jgi:hypothetical protein
MSNATISLVVSDRDFSLKPGWRPITGLKVLEYHLVPMEQTLFDKLFFRQRQFHLVIVFGDIEQTSEYEQWEKSVRDDLFRSSM